MYPFGFGLSYTEFAYSDLKISGSKILSIQFTLKNIGSIKGADVPQIYLRDVDGQKKFRILGFERVELQPGESKSITLEIEPRLLADFNYPKQKWEIQKGKYTLVLGKSAGDFVLEDSVDLKAQSFRK